MTAPPPTLAGPGRRQFEGVKTHGNRQRIVPHTKGSNARANTGLFGQRSAKGQSAKTNRGIGDHRPVIRMESPSRIPHKTVVRILASFSLLCGPTTHAPRRRKRRPEWNVCHQVRGKKSYSLDFVPHHGPVSMNCELPSLIGAAWRTKANVVGADTHPENQIQREADMGTGLAGTDWVPAPTPGQYPTGYRDRDIG